MYSDYHNLTAYQKAKQVTLKIMALYQQLPFPKGGQIIYHQILRSSASIGANIAEGYGRNNRKEYKQFLGIARGSSLETEYWLELITDSYGLQVSDIINLNKEVIKLLTATIKSLSRQ